MHLIRGLQRWSTTSDTVATIGNFDGVHLGHRQLFNAVKRAASQRGLPSTVISFDPLPHEYFAPGAASARLQGFRDRVSGIQDAGIDQLLLLRFDASMAGQSADDFIQKTLVNRLLIKHLVVGDDFRFGHKRSGTFQDLCTAAKPFGYTVEQSPTCLQDGERVSSTRIRRLLKQGKLDESALLLGQPYRISGRVVHGEKVGRQLGFRTANVSLGKHLPPLRGVFAVWAHHLESGKRFAAVANLGERPTVDGRKLLLEVHALDHNVNWYGHHLAVDFVQSLRSEQRFDSLDALKAQIGRDANAARTLLSRI